MIELFKTLKFIYKHPLQRDRKLAALLDFFRWQIGTRLLDHEIIYPFVEDTYLAVGRGLFGATGNVYVGLHELEDMSFCLHLLRKSDLFCDAGANIGTYTILASGVVGAETISIEPIKETFERLIFNINLNKINHLVSTKNIGLGAEQGTLRFSSSKDTMNHVCVEEEGESVLVPVLTLDQLLTERNATVLKLDVEGYEFHVLSGATRMLNDDNLLAVVVEINGFNKQYGIEESMIAEKLTSAGFSPFNYNPFKRELSKLTQHKKIGNTLFIRQSKLSTIIERVKSSQSYSVKGAMI